MNEAVKRDFIDMVFAGENRLLHQGGMRSSFTPEVSLSRKLAALAEFIAALWNSPH